MKTAIHIVNTFRAKDPEDMKRAVTAKIERLINRQLNNGAKA